MRDCRHLLRSCLALAGVMSAAMASAATYEVGSIGDLQSRINNAVAGDVIVVRDGAYTTSAPLMVNRQGTAPRPIRIAAKTTFGVEIAGTHGFFVASPAAHVEISGFRFTHLSGQNQIEAGATHIRFSRNVFECTGDGAYLTVAGDDAEVDRSEFRNKKTVGNMIDVRGAGSQVAQRVRIHHNYFHDFSSPGVNGAETIRFGLSGPAEAYDAVNPLLKADAKGVFRPQPRSPAIDGAKDHYGVALDMDGQPRTGRRDKGADEVSKAPVAAALLTPDDFFRLINDRR